LCLRTRRTWLLSMGRRRGAPTGDLVSRTFRDRVRHVGQQLHHCVQRAGSAGRGQGPVNPFRTAGGRVQRE
jgi:hypothetical protein